MAAAMGIELLTEEQYQELQKLGEFNLKTSSWMSPPEEIRKLGGALYSDRRYDRMSELGPFLKIVDPRA